MSWTPNRLTANAVKRYIESEGARCPRCGSTDLEAGRMQAEGGGATGDVQCFACRARWCNVYTLSAIDMVDAQGQRGKTMTPAEIAPSAPPRVDALFEAIDPLGRATRDPDSAIRDLQAIVRAAWRVMTPAQRTTLLRERELTALAREPECESMHG